MPELRDDDLKKVLEKMLDEMVQKKMLPEGINKKEIVENVMKTFEQNPDLKPTPDKLTDKNVQKALCLALVSEVVAAKNPQMKLDYTVLFADRKDEKDLLQKELSLTLKNFMQALNDPNNPALKVELKPSPNDFEKKLDEMADTLAGKFKFEENQLPAENKNIVDTFEMSLSAALTAFYGSDTRYAGQGAGVEVGPVISMMSGIANTATGSGNSFADDLNRTSGVDYTGSRNTVDELLDSLGDSVTAAIDASKRAANENTSPLSMTIQPPHPK